MTTTQNTRPRSLGFLDHTVLYTQKIIPNARKRIVAESLLLGLLVILVFIWFATPFFARSYVNQTLANLPDYSGKISWIRIHPLTASADVYDFRMDKKTGDVPVPFLHVPRVHLSLQWSQILHGVQRSTITVWNPQIHLVAGPSSAQSQFSISMVWINALKSLVPWKINQLNVHQGELHFHDFTANPPVNLSVDNIEVIADNFTNSARLKIPLPSTIKITANPLVTGKFAMNLAVNFDEKYATFSQKFRLEQVPLVAANSALKKYLGVQAQSGEIGLYSELTGDKGNYNGYVKPFLSNIEFAPKATDQGTIGSLWAGLLNTFKDLVENNQKVVATQTNISGRVDQPNINIFSAIAGIFWNAYIQSLQPGFDPKIAPPPPTDTITTPKSPATQQEAQKLSQQKK